MDDALGRLSIEQVCIRLIQRRGMRQIAHEAGVSPWAVYRALWARGIKPQHCNELIKASELGNIIRLVLDGQSYAEIGRRYDCMGCTVAKFLKRRGLSAYGIRRALRGRRRR